MFSFNTFTFSGPKKPSSGRSMDFSTRLATTYSSSCLAAATLFICARADCEVISGSNPGPTNKKTTAGNGTSH